MGDEELEQLVGDSPIASKEFMKRIWLLIKPEWKHFLLAAIFIICNITLDIICPLIVAQITDILNNSMKDPEVLKTAGLMIGLYAGAYAILGIGNQIFLYFETMILQKAGQRIVYNLRMDIFSHIEHMSQNQLNEMPVGALVTRVTNYATSLSDLFTTTIVSLIRDVLTMVGVYIIMLVLAPLLTLILSGVFIIMIVISIFFRNAIRNLFNKERGYVSNMNAFLSENLSGMRITQIFNQEKRKDEEFVEKNDNLRHVRNKIITIFALYRPTISLLYCASLAITFMVGIQPWVGLTPGAIVGFYLYLSKFFNPFHEIADFLNRIQKASTATKRLFNLLDVIPQVVDKPEAIDIDHFEGKIEFRHVWFAYHGEHWILRDVSFTINPKETAAFVGATGAGKTTILSLIVRNHEIQKGQILIDDRDITTIKVESLRKHIGQMMQDVFLFSGSINTNVALRDEDFTKEEIREACEYVNADKFINKLPDKYEENIIENGANLSAGQRQLLSFARTILHKPDVLFLDEATANIDTETEVLIQESLEKMKSIGTMLVVAHRLSTIQKADQIFVIKDGQIVEHGSHQELLKQKGQYYRLYQIQFEEN